MSFDYRVLGVVRVVDGDTAILDVATEVGRNRIHRHRLTTLDTPERGQPGYLEAGAALRGWLAANQGRLRVIDYKFDNFGRYLSDICVPGGESATSFMLRLGYATYEP